mmetsp:Transcript_1206/g.1925  ORF Transcript_1206/g.1925 Transcript_1206/m.1925 type:complete len:203 (-) Transcript_1206:1147-1755(-)
MWGKTCSPLPIMMATGPETLRFSVTTTSNCIKNDRNAKQPQQARSAPVVQLPNTSAMPNSKPQTVGHTMISRHQNWEWSCWADTCNFCPEDKAETWDSECTVCCTALLQMPSLGSGGLHGVLHQHCHSHRPYAPRNWRDAAGNRQHLFKIHVSHQSPARLLRRIRNCIDTHINDYCTRLHPVLFYKVGHANSHHQDICIAGV